MTFHFTGSDLHYLRGRLDHALQDITPLGVTVRAEVDQYTSSLLMITVTFTTGGMGETRTVEVRDESELPLGRLQPADWGGITERIVRAVFSCTPSITVPLELRRNTPRTLPAKPIPRWDRIMSDEGLV